MAVAVASRSGRCCGGSWWAPPAPHRGAIAGIEVRHREPGRGRGSEAPSSRWVIGCEHGHSGRPTPRSRGRRHRPLRGPMSCPPRPAVGCPTRRRRRCGRPTAGPTPRAETAALLGRPRRERSGTNVEFARADRLREALLSPSPATTRPAAAMPISAAACARVACPAGWRRSGWPRRRSRTATATARARTRSGWSHGWIGSIAPAWSTADQLGVGFGVADLAGRAQAGVDEPAADPRLAEVDRAQPLDEPDDQLGVQVVRCRRATRRPAGRRARRRPGIAIPTAATTPRGSVAAGPDDQFPPHRVADLDAGGRGEQQLTQLVQRQDPVGQAIEAAGVERHVASAPGPAG